MSINWAIFTIASIITSIIASIIAGVVTVIFEGLVDTAAHKREAAILRRRQDNLQQQGWCPSHWAGWKHRDHDMHHIL